MKKEKDFITCTVIPQILGGALWYHEDKLVFCIHRDGKKEDMRKHPPFLAMSPCPYCGAVNSSHDPLKHVDPTLGTPVNPKSE